ncbi:MAG: class I SAM-dependent methyltransferase [Deltaproteobacteria bacterium]
MNQNLLDMKLRRRPHRIFADILREFAADPGSRILDVGCAFGVIGALRGRPDNVIGIERDPQHREAASRHCARLYTFDLNGLSRDAFKEKDFNLIFCADVLEHLEDPDRVLRELTGFLAPGGRVVVSVPNVAQLPFRLKLLAGRFEYTEAGVMARSHLRFYTYATAQTLIRDAGLTVERFYAGGTVVSYINIWPRLLAAHLIFVCRKTR